MRSSALYLYSSAERPNTSAEHPNGGISCLNTSAETKFTSAADLNTSAEMSYAGAAGRIAPAEDEFTSAEHPFAPAEHLSGGFWGPMEGVLQVTEGIFHDAAVMEWLTEWTSDPASRRDIPSVPRWPCDRGR